MTGLWRRGPGELAPRYVAGRLRGRSAAGRTAGISRRAACGQIPVMMQAHTGSNEACPRRDPAPPAHKSLRRARSSGCRPVRPAGPGDHDKYGLGRVIGMEDDTVLIIDFGSRQVRILTPFAELTRL